MIITQKYITQRMAGLLQEMPPQTPLMARVLKLVELTNAKFSLLIWAIGFVVQLLGRRAARKSLREQPNYRHIVQYKFGAGAADFVQYALTHDIDFDASQYFGASEDDYIAKHIDDRIKSVLRYPSRPMTAAEAEYSSACRRMRKSIARRGGFYRLRHEGRDYFLPQNHFELGIWLYHYGLKSLPESVRQYIAGKDFVDVGAFIGDSALVLLEYQPSQVLAYEPVSENYRYMLQTIARNNSEGKIIAINKGLGDAPSEMSISIADSCASMLDNFKGNEPQERVVVSTIDEECRHRRVGVIKMDIEGYEYFAMRGALETIARDKPLLLISIYHTGRDFFEIPPMVKDTVPEYQFKIVDTAPLGIAEKILVGWCE